MVIFNGDKLWHAVTPLGRGRGADRIDDGIRDQSRDGDLQAIVFQPQRLIRLFRHSRCLQTGILLSSQSPLR